MDKFRTCVEYWIIQIKEFSKPLKQKWSSDFSIIVSYDYCETMAHWMIKKIRRSLTAVGVHTSCEGLQTHFKFKTTISSIKNTFKLRYYKISMSTLSSELHHGLCRCFRFKTLRELLLPTSFDRNVGFCTAESVRGTAEISK